MPVTVCKKRQCHEMAAQFAIYTDNMNLKMVFIDFGYYLLNLNSNNLHKQNINVTLKSARH